MTSDCGAGGRNEPEGGVPCTPGNHLGFVSSPGDRRRQVKRSGYSRLKNPHVFLNLLTSICAAKI